MRFQITMAKVLSIILMVLDIDLIQKFLYKKKLPVVFTTNGQFTVNHLNNRQNVLSLVWLEF